MSACEKIAIDAGMLFYTLETEPSEEHFPKRYNSPEGLVPGYKAGDEKWKVSLKNWIKVYGEFSIMYPRRMPITD